MSKQNWNYIELILQQSKRQDGGEVEYKQAFMNFEAVDERICSLRITRKFNNFTIILARATQ
jgi:hypothetical protein